MRGTSPRPKKEPLTKRATARFVSLARAQDVTSISRREMVWRRENNGVDVDGAAVGGLRGRGKVSATLFLRNDLR